MSGRKRRVYVLDEAQKMSKHTQNLLLEKEKGVIMELEEVDPGLLDQAIRDVLQKERTIDKEMAIVIHLSKSEEFREWVLNMAKEQKLRRALGMDVPEASVATAISIGVEIGFSLGKRVQGAAAVKKV